jgi:hypothetical protein
MTHLYNKTEVKKAASTEKEYAFGGSHLWSKLRGKNVKGYKFRSNTASDLISSTFTAPS